MNKDLLQIHYAAWHNWIFFPLVIIIMVLAAILVWRRQKVVNVLIQSPAARTFLHNYSRTSQIAKAILVTLGAMSLFVALLRPQWDKKEEQIEHKGRDVIIALDISRSMLCDDVSPNRLSFAKKKIHSLVKKLSCERIGLLLFAGSPYLVCPLTSDYDSFFMFLDQVDAHTVSAGGTAMDAAIKTALNVYSKMPERKHKLVVLFTDGEDFSTSMAAVKQESAQAGLHIFAFGLGTSQGAPVPLYDAMGKPAGHQKDSSGAVVISRLDEEQLQSVVSDSGGTYIRSSEDDADIKALLHKLQGYEKEVIQEKKKDSFQEKYYIFALISFLCLLLEWLL